MCCRTRLAAPSASPASAAASTAACSSYSWVQLGEFCQPTTLINAERSRRSSSTLISNGLPQPWYSAWWKVRLTRLSWPFAPLSTAVRAASSASRASASRALSPASTERRTASGSSSMRTS